MSKFLNAGTRAFAVVMTTWMFLGCQAEQDEELNQKVAALETAVSELQANISKNQKVLLKEFRKVKGDHQTMIRRGVVIAPHMAEVPARVGDQKDVSLGTAPSIGPANATIEVVEFGEFQCPYCMRHETALTELVEEYPGKVRAGFKHYPMAKHAMALPAARAAWAAQQQGKFWEMHDLLFSSRGELDEDVILDHAKALGLDMEKFQADMEGQESHSQVFKDRREGKAAGVKGTPTYYVNGKFAGADPATVRAVINKQLGIAPPEGQDGGTDGGTDGDADGTEGGAEEAEAAG